MSAYDEMMKTILQDRGLMGVGLPMSMGEELPAAAGDDGLASRAWCLRLSTHYILNFGAGSGEDPVELAGRFLGFLEGRGE